MTIPYHIRKERCDKNASGTTYREAREKGVKYAASKKPSRALTPQSQPFIAYDSEGITINGEHKTILWANSRGDYVFDEMGIDRRIVYDWFLDCQSKHGRSINVVYGGSYDQNMLVKGLTFEKAKDLWDSKSDSWTFDGDYVLKMLPRRMFSVSKFYNANEPWVLDKDGGKKLNIRTPFLFYDVIGFYQESFVNAVTKVLGGDYDELELIKTGKALRHEFAEANKDFILQYCQSELKALVLIMDELRAGLWQSKLKLKKWWGAGSIASSIMEKHNVKNCINRDIATPDIDIFLRGFFGGRIEICKFGTSTDKIYHDDINSAYPSAMVHLPDLSAGRWEHNVTADLQPHTLTIYRVKWENAQYLKFLRGAISFGPFPYRLKDGRVIFPFEGEGWYWQPEIKAALKHGYYENFEIIESYSWIPETDNKPFDFIHEYYLRRRALVAESKHTGKPSMEEKVVKLGLNSLYGKTAQSLGAKRTKPAPFNHYAWAGYITSKTRAMLYDRACESPHDVIAFATDGLYSLAYHGDRNTSAKKELGKWECQSHDKIVIVQSGVYFLRDGNKWGCYTRGFPKPKSQHEARLTIGLIKGAWNHNVESMQTTRTVFRTLGFALSSQENYSRHCAWEGDLRELKLSPVGTKRKPHGVGKPERELLSTLPMEIIDAAKPENIHDVSYPYSPKWRVEDDHELEDDELGLE